MSARARLPNGSRAMSPWNEAVFRSISSTIYNREIRKWEEIVTTNPDRVLSVLDMNDDYMRNSWGDTPQDLFAVLRVLVTSIKLNTSHWKHLVSLRAIDKIITVTIRLMDHARAVADTRGREFDTSPPYSFALSLIARTTINIPTSPTPSDRIVLDHLKARWSELTKRLWEEPDRAYKAWWASLDTYSTIVALVCQVDESFRDLLHSPNDMTIAVLFRLLMHVDVSSTKDQNHRILSSHVHAFHFAVSWPGHYAPYEAIHRIRVALPGQSADAFYAKIASMLSQFREDPEPLEFPLLLLRDIHCQFDNEEFRVAAARSKALWPELFYWLKTEAVKYPILDESSARVLMSSGYTDDNKVQREFVETAAIILIIMNRVCTLSPELIAKEGEGIVMTWIDAGIFDMMDEIVPRVIFRSGMTASLNAIVRVIAQFVQANSSLRSLLRQQFPRPRTLRAMLGRAYTISTSADGQTRFVPVLTPTTLGYFASGKDDGRGYDTPDDVLSDGTWRTFENIRIACRDERKCTRRGCKRKGEKQCKGCPGMVRYCGAECRKRDWQEHRLICGLLRHEDQLAPEGREFSQSSVNLDAPIPIEFPWRFEAARAA